jgi:hypothetical protein
LFVRTYSGTYFPTAEIAAVILVIIIDIFYIVTSFKSSEINFTFSGKNHQKIDFLAVKRKKTLNYEGF